MTINIHHLILASVSQLPGGMGETKVSESYTKPFSMAKRVNSLLFCMLSFLRMWLR